MQLDNRRGARKDIATAPQYKLIVSCHKSKRQQEGGPVPPRGETRVLKPGQPLLFLRTRERLSQLQKQTILPENPLRRFINLGSAIRLRVGKDRADPLRNSPFPYRSPNQQVAHIMTRHASPANHTSIQHVSVIFASYGTESNTVSTVLQALPSSSFKKSQNTTRPAAAERPWITGKPPRIRVLNGDPLRFTSGPQRLTLNRPPHEPICRDIRLLRLSPNSKHCSNFLIISGDPVPPHQDHSGRAVSWDKGTRRVDHMGKFNLPPEEDLNQPLSKLSLHERVGCNLPNKTTSPRIPSSPPHSKVK